MKKLTKLLSLVLLLVFLCCEYLIGFFVLLQVRMDEAKYNVRWGQFFLTVNMSLLEFTLGWGQFFLNINISLLEFTLGTVFPGDSFSS